ncbi:ABC transporter ATP-binding protein [Paraburkholderia sp. SIMBA_055]|jgi:putative spermidine/putrescine transport system ATP-binding protein|uniref:Spermidine/putrescine import ATP-binding protein PotA n=1 Tax=Paraburkholderia graminis TaxID=60548 RepID=A0ABD5CKF5_9BURK|nr:MULTISPECIES: ABC transporter ATP-binding protein [Paraburkholderia]ALE57520.1 ABC transporter ATP-binding protein [Burkholderia sp. HB1]AXF10223.1 polyamine ABC transporter ATP-binding protein [Paraburkholderia graminis]MDQ0624668.1 putative spermidine/putrescine transport system ATP-binding protein [Paraburkholderia graminis]MDR6205826.1 putative spermidine/putrescine transport system ATP-binding protein [Paraburkholderia graminis]MDR6470615.1 putative spermidine/putrescine transport syst
MDARAKTGVSIRSAGKRYGPVVALDDVSLDIAPGEFVSLLGPSGSGKTTLLGILGGFVQPSSGAVWVGENDITFAPPHKRNIGIVFQNYALFPHMTVGENVAFPLRARREPKAGWAKKVADALAMVELSGFEARNISQLSGGQRQRVALARAMVFEPQLILMDEPLSALDKQLRETMQIELRRLHRKLGATIVYVTHDQREALTMSDRVAVLKNGKLVQIDTPERLYDRPCDAFVASFIGEATLLDVSRAGDDAVRLGDALLRTAHPLPRGERLLLAVQTEKLVIDGGSAEGANRLSCRVTEVLYQGESLRVFAALADGTSISLRQPGNHDARRRIPSPGEPMTVLLDPQDTIVVPA